MKIITRIAVLTTALALTAGPSFAEKPAGTPGKGSGEAAAQKLAAPGQYCKAAGASKQKAEGQKKSPFAECVAGQAKARSGKSAREACKAASKKKAEGQKKSSFATCIVAAKDVKADQDQTAPVAP